MSFQMTPLQYNTRLLMLFFKVTFKFILSRIVFLDIILTDLDMHKLLEISFRILIVAVAVRARTLASGRSDLSLGILANWGRKSWPQLTTQ